jgi:hypothetical protein
VSSRDLRVFVIEKEDTRQPMNSTPQEPRPPGQKSRRTSWWLGGLLLVLALVAALAAPALMRRSAPPDPQELAALTQRCQNEMLRGTCGAMNASAPKAGASRLFIAGVGEVDAAAFAALRAAGTEMCTEAAAACRQDWNGNTCRITRALYPLTVAGTGAEAPRAK